MSDQEDFLSRWSRRKREISEAEAVEAAEPAPAGLEQIREAAESAFDLNSLPPIESITAETDIRVFLAAGVPPELKRAALRRAWSADPAIRDFIGLSENSWDFNAPGAMGGFGPLDMTDDLRRMVAQLFTPAPEPESISAVPESRPEVAENSQISTLEQDQKTEVVEEISQRDQLPQSEANIAAAQHQPDEPPTSQTTVRRYHGGALPK